MRGGSIEGILLDNPLQLYVTASSFLDILLAIDERREKMTDTTICVECIYHRGESYKSTAWHQHECHAVGRVEVLDFVTGRMMYVEGGKWPFCRDVNTDGRCAFYEEERRGMFGWKRKPPKERDNDRDPQCGQEEAPQGP